MKIGIFTFHCAHNFGAVLQAYALQTYLRNIGHESYIIDYRPSFLVTGYKKFSIRHWISKNPKTALKKILTEPFLVNQRITKWNIFNQFITKNLNLYPYPLPNQGVAFDLFLFGSDQIWNSDLTGKRWDGIYFGKGLQSKCCSYAASMGWDKVDDARKEEFISLLNNFSAISVREKELYNELEKVTSKPIYLVCDPVFLLSSKQWMQLVHPIPRKEPYVLCFNLLHSEECIEQAKLVSKYLGYQLIEITGNVHLVKGTHKVLQNIGPIDFISYIAQASFVVTSSFHATAFSVIFQKPFYSVGMGIKKGRVSSLLTIIGLENRLLQKVTSNVDLLSYSGSNADKLNIFIKKSKDYLFAQCLS